MDLSDIADDTVMYDNTHCNNMITEAIADSICSWIHAR